MLGPPASDHKSKTAVWLTPRISKLVVDALTRAAIHLDALAAKALSKAWLSYALILLIKSKVIWRIWDIRDITSGDTSRYFEIGFLVDIVWSRLRPRARQYPGCDRFAAIAEPSKSA
jgi:hypothetical protein